MLAPHAVNLHLKDYRIALDPHGVGLRFVGVPLGQGRMDTAGVFDALRRNGRDVSVILEHWLPRAETPEATFAAEDDWISQSISAARQSIASHAGRTP
jgi:L-ribulose-5-phosphate 3-epimerase UlaE